MPNLKGCSCAALLILTAALTCAAQTRSTRTATYEFRGGQSAAGAVEGSPDIYYVTFSGEAKTLNSKLAVSLDVFNFTLQYVVTSAGVGTMSGGQWTAVTINKDRPPQSVGGSVAAGTVLTLGAGGAVAPGNFAVTFEPGDPSWQVLGGLIGSIDKSRPPRAAGQLTLTYPVIIQ
jgi:hypothetical protein